MLAALQNRMKNVLHSSSVAPDEEADHVTPLNETQDNEQVTNDQVAKVIVKGKPSVLVSTTLANNKANSKLKWGSRKADYSHVKSKVPFKDNEAHTPGGGDRQIWHQKLDLSHVRPRVDSSGSSSRSSTPMAGKASMWKMKVDVKHVTSKVGSLDNITHVPGGGQKKIFSEKPRFEHVRSRVGSLDMLAHQPGGGDKKIFSEKPRFDHVRPRVGSLDLITKRKGGHKQKGEEGVKKGAKGYTPEPTKTQEELSLEDVEGDTTGETTEATDNNTGHKKGSKSTTLVRSRVGSLEKINHVPGGGDKKIFTQRLSFQHVRPRIGSLDNIAHVPGGGDKKIYNQPVSYEYYTGKAVVVLPPTSGSNPTTDRSGNSDIPHPERKAENGRRARVNAGNGRQSPSSRGSSVGGPVETLTDLSMFDEEM